MMLTRYGIIAGIVLIASVANAHWDGPTDQALSKWYESQHNAKGTYCCNKSDGHDFFGSYTIDANGDVEFDADGTHHHLPAYMVLTGPNPTGHTVWWFANTDYAGHIDYCFALGSEG